MEVESAANTVFVEKMFGGLIGVITLLGTVVGGMLSGRISLIQKTADSAKELADEMKATHMECQKARHHVDAVIIPEIWDAIDNIRDDGKTTRDLMMRVAGKLGIE